MRAGEAERDNSIIVEEISRRRRPGYGLDPAAPRAAFDRRRHLFLIIGKGVVMLTLYYGPGACSMASHIVLEESGEKYEPKRMDLAKGEQRTTEYLKMNPQGRVPLLQLDNGEPLAENTAILPYLGKRFNAVADGRDWPRPRRCR